MTLMGLSENQDIGQPYNILKKTWQGPKRFVTIPVVNKERARGALVKLLALSSFGLSGLARFPLAWWRTPYHYPEVPNDCPLTTMFGLHYKIPSLFQFNHLCSSEILI